MQILDDRNPFSIVVTSVGNIEEGKLNASVARGSVEWQEESLLILGKTLGLMWELDVPDGIFYFLQNTYLTLTLTSRVLFSVIRITDTSINVDGGGWSRYEML